MTKELLSQEWISKLILFDTLIIGFSGGLDSTVLLHLLNYQGSLKNKIHAIYINHGISPNACDWQHHCNQVCNQLNIKFSAKSVEFNRSANIEEHARLARYHAFSSLMSDKSALILGHHQNDQAETMLLHLLRGTGINGLGGMHEESKLDSKTIYRPLLKVGRDLLEIYAKEHGLHWIEDESNLDDAYSRNYLRQKVMPLLEVKWPSLVENLSRTAAHAQEAQSNLDELALIDCPSLITPQKILSIEPLKKLNSNRLKNVLRMWLKQNQIKIPSAQTLNRIIREEIEAGGDATPLVSWGKNAVRRYQDTLYLDKLFNSKEVHGPSTMWIEFPKPLEIKDKKLKVYAVKRSSGVSIPENAIIEIRFREGGETLFCRGQTKVLKKLMQEWQIPPWDRAEIPLLFINGQLAAVVGYAISDLFVQGDGWVLSVGYG